MFPDLSDSPAMPGSQDQEIELMCKKRMAEARVLDVIYHRPVLDNALETLAKSVKIR